MIAAATARQLAARLDQAERRRTQIRQLSQSHPDLTVEDAYAVQAAWVEIKRAAGRIVKGRKIGLTSRAMQAQLGIDEPDSGILFEDMFFPEGGTIPQNRFIAPRIEVELAFVMGERLAGPHCTALDVLRATEFVLPAFEILDTRIQRLDPETKATRTIVDTVADNAANAGIVVGGRPVRPFDHDLGRVAAICWKNGAVEETGVSAGVLGHPANALAWLANRLGGQGEALEPGQVVLAGSFTRAMEAGSGDTFQADFGPLGTISCHFA